MKVIFDLIKVNELWHYTPECGCKSPASASSCVTACSGASLPSFAVPWSGVLSGYESSQSASTWSNSLFSSNHLQVRFEFNHGRVLTALFLPSDLREQS